MMHGRLAVASSVLIFSLVYLLSIVLAWDELHVGKLSAVCFIAVGAIVFTFAEMSVLSFSVTGVVFTTAKKVDCN